jgi:hypothetical protein
MSNDPIPPMTPDERARYEAERHAKTWGWIDQKAAEAEREWLIQDRARRKAQEAAIGTEPAAEISLSTERTVLVQMTGHGGSEQIAMEVDPDLILSAVPPEVARRIGAPVIGQRACVVAPGVTVTLPMVEITIALGGQAVRTLAVLVGERARLGTAVLDSCGLILEGSGRKLIPEPLRLGPG